MYYESLGGNQYKIILKVYRDCLNGVAPFDNPASIGVFNSSGALIDEILISNPSVTNLPIIVTNPCLQIPPVICTEEGIYEKIVTLNIPNGGLDLVYQRCCRNNIIQNIVTPQDMGSTWVSHIPSPSLAVNNNSAHFINVPPLLLCNEDNLVFDHSAIDPDGDVLVYEMCTPLHGADNINPMPQPPNGGPYVNINWSGGYGVNSQITGTTNLQINATTGELICTPTTNGVFVVGICVKEYRNGVLINTTLRDFQFTVVSCSSNIISAVPDQTVLCDGYTMEFENNSTNSTFYFWDFGDNSTLSDTSLLIEPSYTYPDTGNYEVTLIANPGWPCADTSTATYTVQFPIQATISPVTGQCLDGNNFDFSINGNFTTDVDFNWSFGASSTPLSSTVQNPNGITYGNNGVYAVVSSVSDRGCQKDFTQQVEVYEEPVANIIDLDVCESLTVQALNSSTSATSYFWNFGDGTTLADTSLLDNPSYTYPSTGSYTVELIANNLHCSDTTTAIYKVKAPMNPVVAINDPFQCLTGNSYDFGLSGDYTNGANFTWSFGSPTTAATGSESIESPQDVTYLVVGEHIVSITIVDEGCTRVTTVLVDVKEEPIASFLDVDTCESLTVNTTNQTILANSYEWDFGNGTNSTLEFPSATYLVNGTYPVTLIASNDFCSDTTHGFFKVKEPMHPTVLTNDPFQCLTGNSYNFDLTGNYTNSAVFTWSFGSPTNSPLGSESIESPQNIEYLVIGEHIVELLIEDEGCTKDTTILVDVKEEPIASFLDVDTCESLTVNATNLSTIANSYEWNFGNGTNSTLESPSATYLVNGTYPVTLIAYNDFCSDTTQGIFKVKDSIKPIFTMNLNPQCITSNSFDFSLSGNYTSGATFDWDFAGPSLPLTSVDENPLGVVYDSEGYYPVVVSVTDEGCTVLYKDTAKVFPSPTIGFEILDTVGCMPLLVRFRDTSIAWGNVDYSWTFGDGNTSIDQNPNHVYTNTGLYDVSFSLTTNEGCLETLTATKLNAIFVAPRPVADFSFTPENTTIYFPEIEITDLSQGEVSSQYYSIEGNTINGTDVTYSLDSMGVIPIHQTIVNSYGCEDTITKYVNVKPDDVLYVPNTFSPNNDGINDYFFPVAYGLRKYDFYVFNRWGDIIYEGNNSSLGWDGTENGKLVQNGVFVWKIKFRNHKNKSDIKVGHVTVYR